MRIVFGLLFLGAALVADANPDTTNNCLIRIDQLVELVSQRVQATTNDAGRIDCIVEYLNKIKGLASIVHTLADAEKFNLADEKPAAAEGGRVMVQSACARAEKLAAAAADCLGTGPADSPTNSRPSSSPSRVLPPVTNRMEWVAPRGDIATCLTHAKLAALLVTALDLEEQVRSTTAIQLLTKQAIEPLSGWRADRCVTLGDFCAVVVRALDLKVVNPADPASYIQAVHNDGLPVDELLAYRPADVLHEAAVRAFLGRGYAAPLPSSRLLRPD